ncbi:MAG: 4Fe-4S binding protein [Deltaproteobacteria bacterium]|nr:4Fe-4S binding protein [Deltaproteobacteria bacterium]
MLNLNCVRETEPRGTRDEEIRIDFERHDPLLTPEEAKYEASRCLGNVSCEACDVCRLLCPDLAITRDKVTGEIIIDLDYCKGCGICAAVCPKGAITMVLEEGT